MELIEGRDGRLYLHYGKGAVYRIYNRGTHGERGSALALAQITACDYDIAGEREQYAVAITKPDGKAITEKLLDLDELKFYLSEGSAEELETGEAVEAPLLPTEVRDYYYDRRARRRQASDVAKGMLEGNKDRKGKPEYQELVKAQKAIEKELARAIVAETDDLPAMVAEYARLCGKRKAMIGEMGFDLRLFQPEQPCPLCGDMGIIKHIIRKGDKEKGEREVSETEICACAYAREAEIRAYSRTDRLVKRLGKEWASWQPEPPPQSRCGQTDELSDGEPLQIEGEGDEAMK